MQLAPLFWDMPLASEVTPKRGPVRKMVTLSDVRTAMVYDLPSGTTKQPHWLNGSPKPVSRPTSALQPTRFATRRSMLKAGCRHSATK